MARGAARRTVVAMAFRRPAPVLFVTMFASQASLLVLTAILPDLAAGFGVSTATAGQARTLAAVAGGVTALALGRLGRHLGVRELLLARTRPRSGRLPGERARAQPGRVRLRTGGDRSGGGHPAVRGRGGRRRVEPRRASAPGCFRGPFLANRLRGWQGCH